MSDAPRRGPAKTLSSVKAMGIRIDDMELSVRTANVLTSPSLWPYGDSRNPPTRPQHQTLGDFVMWLKAQPRPRNRLVYVQNCGRKTIRELMEVLAEMGVPKSVRSTLEYGHASGPKIKRLRCRACKGRGYTEVLV